MTRPPRHRPRPRITVLPSLALILLLVACSGTSAGVATIDGDGDASATPSPSAGSEDPEEAMFAFAECMREEGIDMPDPVIRRIDASGSSGGGTIDGEADSGPAGAPSFDPNSEEFQAAEEACQHHLDAVGALEPGSGPELTPEEEEAFLAFTECMREHGIDMPDFGGGAIQLRGDDEGAFDPGSEEFQAAEEACRKHLDALPGRFGEARP